MTHAGAGFSVPTTVLHVTDLHLRARVGERLLGVDTAESLRAVLTQALAEHRPDALLATGDIAHDPEPDAYARYLEIVREFFAGPLLTLPGNHDLEAPMRHLFSQPAVLSLGRWQIVGLDSHVDDRAEARVDAERLEALKSACAAAGDRPVIVATHHPPLPVGSPWLDKDRIQNGAELLEWLAEHSTARAVVFGHAHQLIESRYRHIGLLGTPSTCFQFAPASERFSIDTQKPGYRWLRLTDAGVVQSEVRLVADFDLTIELG